MARFFTSKLCFFQNLFRLLQGFQSKSYEQLRKYAKHPQQLSFFSVSICNIAKMMGGDANSFFLEGGDLIYIHKYVQDMSIYRYTDIPKLKAAIISTIPQIFAGVQGVHIGPCATGSHLGDSNVCILHIYPQDSRSPECYCFEYSVRQDLVQSILAGIDGPWRLPRQSCNFFLARFCDMVASPSGGPSKLQKSASGPCGVRIP